MTSPQRVQQLLPQVIQRTITPDSLLANLIQVMEDYHLQSHTILNEFERYLDPFRTPDEFVLVLASWFDLDKLWIQDPDKIKDIEHVPPFPTGIGRLRRLLAVAMEFSQSRGTKLGLISFLETAIGVKGFRIDENINAQGLVRPFHIVVHIPVEAKAWRGFIERIIEFEKPIHLTFEVLEDE